MKRVMTTISLILLVHPLISQNYERVVFGSDSESDYYLVVPPESDEISGALILLPGFNQNAESIFPETKIHNIAYLRGILTIAIAGGPNYTPMMK